METKDVMTKTKWSIDEVNSQVGFKVKYLVFSTVRGNFRRFDASIYTTGDEFLSAEIDFWIDPASIDTGVAQRDEHLRNPDFFDVEQYREINFYGNTIMASDRKGHYDLYGELTMRGIKKQIKLHIESGGMIKDPWGTEKALFSVHGTINRKDWELNWNTLLEAGGVLVSENVEVNCEILLVKKA